MFKIREQSGTRSYQLSPWTPSLTQQPPSSPKRNTSVAWLRRRRHRLSLSWDGCGLHWPARPCSFSSPVLIFVGAASSLLSWRVMGNVHNSDDVNMILKIPQCDGFYIKCKRHRPINKHSNQPSSTFLVFQIDPSSPCS